MVYDLGGTRTATTTTGASTEMVTFDGLLRPVSTSRSLGGLTAITETELDGDGRAVVAWRPHHGVRGGSTSTSYDVLGRPEAVTRSDGTSSYASYVDYAWPDVTYTDAEGNARVVTLDGYGREAEIVPPVGGTTRVLYEGATATERVGPWIDLYDSNGLQVGQQIRYLDGDGAMWALDDDAAGLRTWERNAAGDVVCETDELGVTQARTYDFAGRPLSLHDGTGCATTTWPTWRWSYDGDGIGSGWTCEHCVGRLSASSDEVGRERYSYDAQGRVSASDRQIGLNTWAFSYARDSEGNPSGWTLTKGSQSYTWSAVYGTGGRLSSADVTVDLGAGAGPVTTSVIGSTMWHPSGRLATMALGNGASASWDEDGFGRLSAVRTTGLSHDVDLAYGYDGEDRVVSVTDPQGIDTYAVNAAGVLTDVAYGDDGTTQHFGWDDAWNMTEMSGSYGGFTGRSYSHGRDASLVYDAVGNVRRDATGVFLSYTPRGQLNAATDGLGSRKQWFDAGGRLVMRRQGAALTQYVRDADGRLIGLAQGTIPAGRTPWTTYTALTRVYLWGPAGVVATVRPQTGAVLWVHTDARGDVRSVSDSTRRAIVEAERLPFYGARRAGGGGLAAVGTGGHEDIDARLKLADWGARPLLEDVPGFGSLDRRWLGDPSRPWTLNRRLVANGNPMVFGDPSGGNPLVLAALGAAVEAYLWADEVATVFDYAAAVAAWWEGNPALAHEIVATSMLQTANPLPNGIGASKYAWAHADDVVSAAKSVVARGAKRGPKTDPMAPHNARIRKEAERLMAEGNVILAGGGTEPEKLVKTPGGVKSGRRPDILYETPVGELRAVNVGKTMADGSPVPREVDALSDLNGPGGLVTDFVPYDR